MKLAISDKLSLSLDFVTSTQIILAQKGKGKTHTAVVEAEELLDQGQQIVVIDPTDAWWGLRSSPDGRSTGYPIAVFGGDHGDVELEPGGGALLATAIVNEGFSAIVSTENLTKAKELTFVADFMETLYRLNRKAVHLFVDEADIFAPQKPFGGEARTCGAADDIVRRGRKKGIGCTLITQRSSVLNKNVLSQADMLMALGCSHPRDLDAIGEWVKVHADPKLAKQMMESLPSLPRGDAWAWNPAADIFKRITIRDRRTFDSGRTPKPGEGKRVAKVLAPVDIRRLGATIAAQVERAKENDPAALKAKVRELEKRLAEKTTITGPHSLPIGKTKTVERNIVKDAQIARLEKMVAQMEEVSSHFKERAAAASSSLRALIDRADGQAMKLEVEAGLLRAELRKVSQSNLTPLSLGMVVRMPMPTVMRTSTPTAGPIGAQKHPPLRVAVADGRLAPREMKVLAALSWWASVGVVAPDMTSVAFVAGYSPNSSSWEKSRSILRSGGFVEYPTPGAIQLTEPGRLEVGDSVRSPTTLAALHGMVFDRLAPRERKLLAPLLEWYPNVAPMAELAEASGYSPDSSSFEKARSILRGLGVIDYPKPGHVQATPLLFPEALS